MQPRIPFFRHSLEFSSRERLNVSFLILQPFFQFLVQRLPHKEETQNLAAAALDVELISMTTASYRCQACKYEFEIQT